VSVSSPPARVARAIVNRVAGDKIRVVRVVGGVARGRRLALDLSTEKAYWLGHYERPLQRFLREHVGPADTFFDVGAHVGFFSVCAASLGARVVAVEPDPSNAARLRRNVELNGFDVTVVEAAAWDETGTVDLVGGASPKERVAVPGERTASVSLDDLAERHGLPTVVKVDVEGAESRVLEGAKRVLAEASPVVVCELHGDEQRRLVPALLPGYAIVQLDSPYRIAAVRSMP
jgi:FkbM family methyltransferase